MKRKIQNTLVGLLLAGSAVLVSVNVAAARGQMGGHTGPQNLMRAEFSELDANGDGGITMDEVQALGAARFAMLDTNASGTLDKDEVIAMISTGIERRMGGKEHGAGNGEHARADRAERQAPDAARIAWMADGMMLRFDKDSDGFVSAEEMQPAADRLEKMFARLDSDSDGSISQAEFDAAKEGQGGRRGREGRTGQRGQGGQGGHDRP